MRTVTNGLNLLNRPIDNVADPASPQQVATKNYVDGMVRGLDWKQEVVAGSTGNVVVAAPGTTLDGITLVSGDRILLKDQTAGAENGIWVWTGNAAALTRSLDADSGTELSGATTTVQRGTVNADRVYRVLTDDAIVVGTTTIVWAQVGGAGAAYTAGNGLTLTGQSFDVVPGTGLLVTADTVLIDVTVVARKFAVSVGGATSSAVVHNFGTRDVQVTVMDNTSFEEVLADVVHTDLNTVTVSFATAPAAAAYRVIVQG